MSNEFGRRESQPQVEKNEKSPEKIKNIWKKQKNSEYKARKGKAKNWP